MTFSHFKWSFYKGLVKGKLNFPTLYLISGKVRNYSSINNKINTIIADYNIRLNKHLESELRLNNQT